MGGDESFRLFRCRSDSPTGGQAATNEVGVWDYLVCEVKAVSRDSHTHTRPDGGVSGLESCGGFSGVVAVGRPKGPRFL